MANNQLPTVSVITFKKCNVITQKDLDELKKNAELNKDQKEELTNLKITHLKLIEKNEKKKTKWHEKKQKLKNQNKQLTEEIIQKNQEIKMLKKTINKIKTAFTDTDLTAIPASVISAPVIKKEIKSIFNKPMSCIELINIDLTDDIEKENIIFKCCLCKMYYETSNDLEIHIDTIHSDIFRNANKL